MRTKECGLGTGAIVGIVVAIVAVAIVVPVSFLVLTGGTGGGNSGSTILAGLPKYPGAQVVENADATIQQILTQYGVSSTWSGKGYITSSSPETVTDWYKSNMSGWEKVLENTTPDTSTGTLITMYSLAYTKGNDAAVIITFDYSGAHIMLLLAGPNQSTGGTTGNTGTGGTTGATTT